MKKFYLFLSLLLFINNCLIGQVLNPDDLVTRWEDGDPTPSQPAFGQIGKWVASEVVNWDTESFKPYIFKGMPFRLMFPKNYDPNRVEGYPIIVMFHGRGESGEITDNERQLVHGASLHKDAINNGDYDGFLLYGQNTSGWWNSYLYSVINELVTQKMPQEINIDINKVYVHGLSSGGIGVWEMIINYPLFAACALPMSASSSYQNNILNRLKFTPMWIFQGSEDSDPPPARTTSQVNALIGLGADVTYTIYEGVGHGTWNRAYNESDFFPFMNSANKTNPWVLYGQSEFCPGEGVDVTIGVTAGFDDYEWRKDGIIITGANGNTINVNEYGIYDVRIKRGSQWSYWSPIPVEIKIKEPTITPPIALVTNMSKVIPSPDDSDGVILGLPEGYESYQWRRVSDNSVVGTSSTLTVTTPGEYIASVTELNGCSSNFSDPFLVVDANGSNAPTAINGLVSYAPSKTTIQLNWSDNPNASFNEIGFEIYRSEISGGPYEFIDITESDILSYLDEGLDPNTEYYYIIRPVNNSAAGPTSPETSARTQVDTQAPTSPLNLQVVSTRSNLINLTWEPSTDNVEVYRYDIYQNGIKAVVTESTSATIYNLVEGQLYNFVVKARDVTGNESPASNQVVAIAANSGLIYSYYEGTWSALPDFNTLTPVASGQVDNVDISLREQDNSFAFLWEGFINISVAGTYTFETRSDDGSKLYIGGYDEVYLLVDNDGLHGTTSVSAAYTFDSPGTYPIAISFFENGGGEVMEVYWSNDQGLSRELIPDSAFGSNIEFLGDVPSFPTNLTAQVVSYEQINLNWIDNSDNETGFQIYRADNPSGIFYPVKIVPSNTTSFSDVGLEAQTTYYYKVLALGEYGDSGFSDEINTGLTYYYYEGSFSNLDQLETATPVLTGTDTNFDLTPREQNNNFAFKWEGNIRIPEDGEYTFYTASDDGSELFIDDTQVVFNDYNQGKTERSGVITLSEGSYPIKVLFRQGTGSYVIDVSWAGPNISKELIPEDALREPDINATTLSLPLPPNKPESVSITPLTNTSIKLDWIDNSNDESSFEVYRSANDNTNFLPFTTLPANSVSYVDVNLFPGVEYFYKIVAVNVGGSSESDEVSSKTLNTSPEVTSIQNQSMRFNTTLTINLYAEDVDDNFLSYSVNNLPSFGQLVDYGDGSGQLIFNPTTAQQGTYSDISVTIDDQNGGIVSTVFSLEVNDNYLPTLDLIDNQTLSEGSSLEITLSAEDLNTSDVLTWSSEGLPPFATLTSTVNGIASLLLEPSFSDVGTYTVMVTVADSKGGTDSQVFNINVEDTPVGQTIYINLNGTGFDASSPWNNTHKDAANGDDFGDLLDDQGNVTSVGITTSDFGYNTLGSTNSNGVYPVNVMRTSYFSSRSSESITVYGLDNSLSYDFVFFGSRNEATVINRNTVYTINGQSVTLNASTNSTETVEILGISPDANGEIGITISRASGSSYLYLNALVIRGNFDDGTIPAAPRNLAINSVSGEQIEITWLDAAYNEDGYEIYRSTDELGPYTLLNPGGTSSNVTSYIDNTIAGSTTYYYKIRSFNANGISDYSEILTVSTPNAPPVLSAIGVISVKTDELITVNLTALDSDPGDVLTFSVSNLPEFVDFTDNGNGTADMVLSPTSSDEDIYDDIVISVEDNNGGIDSEIISINVTNSDILSVYINFNNTLDETFPWNNTSTLPSAGYSMNNLEDETGTGTGINLTLVDAWAGDNSLGVNTGNNSGIYPDNVIRTAYWESTTNTKRIRLSGLSTNNKYNFIFFASRDGEGNRTTNYSINGETVSLNASYNSTNTVQINGISPNVSGEVTVNASKASGASYGYLNAMIIQIYEDNGLPLAPSDLVAAGTSSNSISLDWSDNSDNETNFEIWKSSNYTGPYYLVHTTEANETAYSESVSTNSTFYYRVRAINSFGVSDFTEIVGASTIAFTVNINFNADNPAGAPWNNFNSDPFPNTLLNNLVNNLSNNTGISIQIVESNPDFDEFSFGFDGTNPYGMVTGSNSGVVPDNVMRSTYWMDPNKAAQLRVTGLNLAFSYNFVFFASRDGGGNRSTNYSINNRIVTLNASYNTSNTVQINGVNPDDNGEVLITVATAPGSSFGYIGGLMIQAYPKTITSQSNTRIAAINNNDDHEISISSSQINTAYPNPFEDHISLSLELNALDKINISIRSITGQLIYTKDEMILESGYHNIDLDLSKKSLNSGLYLIEVESFELGKQIVKMIKL